MITSEIPCEEFKESTRNSGEILQDSAGEAIEEISGGLLKKFRGKLTNLRWEKLKDISGKTYVSNSGRNTRENPMANQAATKGKPGRVLKETPEQIP